VSNEALVRVLEAEVARKRRGGARSALRPAVVTTSPAERRAMLDQLRRAQERDMAARMLAEAARGARDTSSTLSTAASPVRSSPASAPTALHGARSAAAPRDALLDDADALLAHLASKLSSVASAAASSREGGGSEGVDAAVDDADAAFLAAAIRLSLGPDADLANSLDDDDDDDDDDGAGDHAGTDDDGRDGPLEGADASVVRAGGGGSVRAAGDHLPQEDEDELIRALALSMAMDEQ
jgi:hypothetical protein